MYQCMDCSCHFSVEGEHKTVAEEAHVLIGENECGYCGTITAGCAHVNKEFIDETVESLTYTDNGNGETHTITLTNVAEIWHCNTCGEEFEIHVDVKSEIKSHVFWDGVCKCGMLVNAHCEHANHSEPVEDSRVDAVYTCVSRTHHEVTYVPLMRYDCTDCGCRVMTHEEQTTVTEEHEISGETECAYCGEFGDFYTLNILFEGYLPAGMNGHSKSVKAGSTVKLPISVGSVAENGGDPTRLESWTETDVPEGRRMCSSSSLIRTSGENRDIPSPCRSAM